MTRLSGSLWLDLSHWVFVLTKVERCWNGHAGRMGWNSNLSFYLILVLWNAVACLSYLSSSEICEHFSMGYDCTFDILWQPSNTDSASISLLTPQQVSLRSVLLSESTPCHAATDSYPSYPSYYRSYPVLPSSRAQVNSRQICWVVRLIEVRREPIHAMGFFVLISWNTLKSIEIIQLDTIGIPLDLFGFVWKGDLVRSYGRTMRPFQPHPKSLTQVMQRVPLLSQPFGCQECNRTNSGSMVLDAVSWDIKWSADRNCQDPCSLSSQQ